MPPRHRLDEGPNHWAGAGSRVKRSSTRPVGWVIHRCGCQTGRAVDERIDDRGLHLTVGGQSLLLEVDHVVICAGQDPLRDLEEPLKAAGVTVHRIGGADEATELDAERAIRQGTLLAASL